MIHRLSYNDWQEWIIRVGCLFIVIGVHLWLLFFSENNYAISGEKGRESIVGPLSLSFSTVHKSELSESVERKEIDSLKPKEVKQVKPKPVADSKADFDKKIEAVKKKVEEEEPIREALKNEALETNKNIMKESETALAMNSAVNNEVKMPTPTIVYKPQLAEPPVPPVYPRKARRKKQQGTVWLDILLDESGAQKVLAIYKSSGYETLDKAAISAVQQWRFAKVQGHYTANNVKIRIPIEFLLN